MEQHKKVLGILFLITSILQIMVLSGLALLWSTLYAFIVGEMEPDQARIVELIFSLLRFIPWIIIIFISLPSLMAGYGLINGQPWALTLALILGCFKLFSFPIGTAIGVYAIWVYLESSRLEKEQTNNV